ncbi:hypothetical protein BDA99DRAFT_535146 [Phascolomyces articulosus]|uniref:Uncharacterized protein n=1 Tax=Phascolomyces articulosus TaxID=60185 RepID=A0AAD5KFA8_9FUNG|nr:hypothetical protein BDA99DRAFT_535146 [Phascolomyces articulosus]
MAPANGDTNHQSWMHCVISYLKRFKAIMKKSVLCGRTGAICILDLNATICIAVIFLKLSTVSFVSAKQEDDMKKSFRDNNVSFCLFDSITDAGKTLYYDPSTCWFYLKYYTTLSSNEFNSCNGEFDPTGNFTFIPNSPEQLEGLFLAQQNEILDGSTGTFAGTVVGPNHSWLDMTTGASIRDFSSTKRGGSNSKCKNFQGRFPRKD